MTGKYLKRKITNAKKWFIQRPYYIRRFWNRKLIGKRNFTIISNNCWAGKTYQYLDMPYLSPTVGLYFFAEDYLRFVSNLRYYLSLDLRFISAEESRYADVLRGRNQLHVPIGIIDDVEIVFLHYATAEEAEQKWNRRKKRVNYNDVFLKFSNMNLCTSDCMKQFDRLPFENKFMLNKNKQVEYNCEIYWSGESNDKEVLNDTNQYPGNLKLWSLLNRTAESYPKEGLGKENGISKRTKMGH